MKRFNRYRQDPYWTTARFQSVCSCGQKISIGDNIFYYPPYRSEKGSAVCDNCGREGESYLRDEINNEKINLW